MNLLPCPWCGRREETEFVYGSEAGRLRPSIDDSPSADDWAGYLHDRRNEKGPVRELWCHSGGCGEWFVLLRDTLTHEIEGAFELTPSETERDR
jgi:sarcosine oxidase subunit delta